MREYTNPMTLIKSEFKMICPALEMKYTQFQNPSDGMTWYKKISWGKKCQMGPFPKLVKVMLISLSSYGDLWIKLCIPMIRIMDFTKQVLIYFRNCCSHWYPYIFMDLHDYNDWSAYFANEWNPQLTSICKSSLITDLLNRSKIVQWIELCWSINTTAIAA